MRPYLSYRAHLVDWGRCPTAPIYTENECCAEAPEKASSTAHLRFRPGSRPAPILGPSPHERLTPCESSPRYGDHYPSRLGQGVSSPQAGARPRRRGPHLVHDRAACDARCRWCVARCRRRGARGLPRPQRSGQVNDHQMSYRHPHADERRGRCRRRGAMA